MQTISIFATVALLTTCILAGEKSHEDLKHGHGLEWLKKIKVERT